MLEKQEMEHVIKVLMEGVDRGLREVHGLLNPTDESVPQTGTVVRRNMLIELHKTCVCASKIRNHLADLAIEEEQAQEIEKKEETDGEV